jgi:hypothetical protein
MDWNADTSLSTAERIERRAEELQAEFNALAAIPELSAAVMKRERESR